MYFFFRNKNDVIFIDSFHKTIKTNLCYSLKTTLLKWRPDFDIAAAEYTIAGKIYVDILYL